MVLGFLAAAIVSAPATWTMVAGGDIMLNGVGASRDPFAKVAKAFREADLAYANLEIPLTSARTGTSRKTAADLRARNQYILKADPGHGKHLAATGFDVLTLGNNHAMDYREAGLAETTRILDAAKILWTGAGANREQAQRLVVYRTKGGLRVGFLAYLAFMSDGGLGKCTPAGDKSPGVAVLSLGGSVDEADRAQFRRRVQQARGKCDVLCVAMHWGIEKMTKPTAYQTSLGRAWIDAGADVILGAHPHVLQPVEMYKGKPILYSMGNLVSPRPATTAVYRMRFRGTRCERVEKLPARITGGSVTLVRN